MRLKISPSLLDQFRVVYNELYGKGSKDLIEYMLGEFEISEAVSRGTAYHKLLEYGGDKYLKDGKYQVYERDLDRTWVFTKEAAQPALDLHSHYSKMLHETWVDYDTTILGHSVKMRMRLDGLDGLRVQEFKSTKRKPSVMDYRSSLQWRCNLLALPECQDVTYHIFQIGSRNNDGILLHARQRTSDRL